jgi:hypothetical protein
VRSVLGIPVFNLSNDVQEFCVFDFFDETAAQVGKDVVFEAGMNTFAMALGFRFRIWVSVNGIWGATPLRPGSSQKTRGDKVGE